MKNANNNTITNITINLGDMKNWLHKNLLYQISFGKTTISFIAFLIFGIVQLHSQEYLDLIRN